jgi:hypothetical protein
MLQSFQFVLHGACRRDNPDIKMLPLRSGNNEVGRGVDVRLSPASKIISAMAALLRDRDTTTECEKESRHSRESIPFQD